MIHHKKVQQWRCLSSSVRCSNRVAGTAAVAPSTIDAVRGGALGAKKSGITKTALKTLGRGLVCNGSYTTWTTCN